MTLITAQQALSRAVEELWQAVGELALIVYEDRPRDADLAVVDDLAEQVSELQGEVAAARQLLRVAEGRTVAELVPCLPEVSAHLDATARRYWRRLRAHTPVAELRRAARSRRGELPGWQHSVDDSAARCEEPLVACAAAMHACWQEVCGTPAGLVDTPPARPPVPADPRRSS